VKLARVVDAPMDKRASSWKPAGSRASDVASVSRVVTVERKKRASIRSARSNEIERDRSIRMQLGAVRSLRLAQSRTGDVSFSRGVLDVAVVPCRSNRE